MERKQIEIKAQEIRKGDVYNYGSVTRTQVGTKNVSVWDAHRGGETKSPNSVLKRDQVVTVERMVPDELDKAKTTEEEAHYAVEYPAQSVVRKVKALADTLRESADSLEEELLGASVLFARLQSDENPGAVAEAATTATDRFRSGWRGLDQVMQLSTVHEGLGIMSSLEEWKAGYAHLVESQQALAQLESK